MAIMQTTDPTPTTVRNNNCINRFLDLIWHHTNLLASLAAILPNMIGLWMPILFQLLLSLQIWPNSTEICLDQSDQPTRLTGRSNLEVPVPLR